MGKAEIISQFDQGNYAMALGQCLDFQEQRGFDPGIQFILGESLLQSGMPGPAKEAFRIGYERAGDINNLVGFAELLAGSGDIEDALSYVSKALRMDPFCVRAWQNLALLRRFKKADPYLEKAKRMQKGDRASGRLKRTLGYVLCKGMNDQGRWSQAWDYAQKAAAIETPAYDPSLLRIWERDMRATITAELLAKGEALDETGDAPVFIVGMPRSGTSLVEAILSQSDELNGAGELRFIANYAQSKIKQGVDPAKENTTHQWLDHLQDAEMSAFRGAYLNLVRQSVTGRHIDKMPGNLLHLGLISRVFPDARIIYVARDPMDVCVSCFLGEFGNNGNFTYRSDWLAETYAVYGRVAAFYQELLGSRMLTLSYEDLVRDPLSETRKLAAFAQVPWGEEMLDPRGSNNICLTRSTAQIRNKVNTKSVGRWKRYGAKTDELRAALEAHGVHVSG